MAFKDSKVWSVAVFLCDRAYGGPEEGGWWYECGEPVEEYSQFTRYFINKSEAFVYQNRLQARLCNKLNEGRREISSVLSEGQYYATINEGPPVAYPQTRPYYD